MSSTKKIIILSLFCLVAVPIWPAQANVLSDEQKSEAIQSLAIQYVDSVQEVLSQANKESFFEWATNLQQRFFPEVRAILGLRTIDEVVSHPLFTAAIPKFKNFILKLQDEIAIAQLTSSGASSLRFRDALRSLEPIARYYAPPQQAHSPQRPVPQQPAVSVEQRSVEQRSVDRPASSRAAAASESAAETRAAKSKDETVCKICRERQKSFIFLPCCHYVCCETCATIINQRGQPCPMCRRPIHQSSRVWESDGKLCILCKQHQKNVIFLPCCHYCCCRECDKKILQLNRPCPMCNLEIQRSEQVYES